MEELENKIEKEVEVYEENEGIESMDDFGHNDLIATFKLGMEFALEQVIKDYVNDGNPEIWLNKIKTLKNSIKE